MDRIDELVRRLAPDAAPPSESTRARERDALTLVIAKAGRSRARPERGRRTPGGRWGLALAGGAAAAAFAAILLAGRSSPPRHTAAMSVVLTAVRRALVDTGRDIEEVHTSVSGPLSLSATAWVDLATGACRSDTSVNERPALAVFVERERTVIVDYAARTWWTRPSGGAACEPLTPSSIEHDLRTGAYTLAGHATVDGQVSLKLVAVTTTTGLHPVRKKQTLWVNATTHLPIQASSSGHLMERTAFRWQPATAANTAILKVSIPVGFRQISQAPTRSPSTR